STRQRHAYFVLEQPLAARFGEPPRREAERARAAPEERFQGIVVEFGGRKAAQLAAFERGDREAVAIEHPVRSDRADARLRGDDADEIERIGAGERDELAALVELPHRAQPPDRIGERELLAPEPRDEAPAARTPLVLLGGRKQRAQAPEAVRRNETQASELAERALGLRAQLPRGGHDLMEERCAPRAQRRVYGPGLRAELARIRLGGGPPPPRVLAQHQGDRRAAQPGLPRAGRRRQPPPG